MRGLLVLYILYIYKEHVINNVNNVVGLRHYGSWKNMELRIRPTHIEYVVSVFARSAYLKNKATANLERKAGKSLRELRLWSNAEFLTLLNI